MVSLFGKKSLRVILLFFILFFILIMIYPKNSKINISNAVFQKISENKQETYIDHPHNQGKSNVRLPVPKKVIRTWCTSDIKKECGGRRSPINAINKTKEILPDWEHIIYSDKDIDEFFDEYFGQDHIITKSYYLINPIYGAARADFFRYVVMYIHGGLYLDSKSCVNAKLPEIPDDKDMIVSHWPGIFSSKPNENILNTGSGEYENWFIYTRPRAPVLVDVINTIINNIQLQHVNPTLFYGISQTLLHNCHNSFGKSVVLFTTGPIAYTLAINKSDYFKDILVQDMSPYLQYMCYITEYNVHNKQKHYSTQKEPLIFPNKTAKFTTNNLFLTENTNVYPSFNLITYNNKNANKLFYQYFDKNIYNKITTSTHNDIIWKYLMLYLNGGISSLSENKDTIIINKEKSINDNNVYILDNGLIMFLPFNPMFIENIMRILNNDLSKKQVDLNKIDWHKYLN